MSSKTLKKALALSVVTVGILGFFLSCENPFTNNMGEKVTRVLPTISVTEPPNGAYIFDTITFKGEATADRALTGVEFRILEDDEGRTPQREWTSTGVNYTPGGTLSDFSFTLDTQVFGQRPGIEVPYFADGLFRIQFRALDNAGNEGLSTEYTYTMKNFGPEIKMTFPSVNSAPTSTPKRDTGSMLRVQVIDIRGIHPEYPQIKIWPTTNVDGTPRTYPGGLFSNTEPLDDDPQFGYARMFRSGFDDPIGHPVSGSASAGDFNELEGYYAERSNGRLYAAQFEFKLDTVASIDPVTRKVTYVTKLSDSLDPTSHRIHDPLEFKVAYAVRVRAYETEFDENYQFVVDQDGKAVKGKDGNFPPFNFFNSILDDDDSRKMEDTPIALGVNEVKDPPVISLSNLDIYHEVDNQAGNKALLDIRPNTYYTDPNSSKIFVNTAGREHFRFQVLAKHRDGIAGAILEFRNGAQTGWLPWDSTRTGYGAGSWAVAPGTTYYHPSTPKGGHRGWVSTLSSHSGATNEAFFVFSAINSTSINGIVVNGGVETTTPLGTIFQHSVNWYDLIVTAEAKTGATSRETWKVLLDGRGPAVRIQSVDGATSGPLSSDFGVMDNARNDSPYTVNGNIRINLSTPTDDSGIMGYSVSQDPLTDINYMGLAPDHDPLYVNGSGYPMIKWIIEDKDPDVASDSILKKLTAFRSTPTRTNVEFFYNDIQPDTNNTQGWVTITKEGVYDKYGFSLNTDAWDGKEVWLYVIAQDKVYNLGYIMQKIKVDINSDNPVINVPLLSATTEPITTQVYTPGPTDWLENPTTNTNYLINSQAALEAWVQGRTQNGTIARNGNSRRNILAGNENLTLNFTDDDGIEPGGGNITVTLTDLNVAAPQAYTLNAADLAAMFGTPVSGLPTPKPKAWSGSLTPAMMARMLPGAAQGSGATARLRAGLYKLDVRVIDDAGSKIDLGGGTPPTTAEDTKTYYFAVYTAADETDKPFITINSHYANELINSHTVSLYGSVKSRLRIQDLWITVNPNIGNQFAPPIAFETINGVSIVTGKGTKMKVDLYRTVSEIRDSSNNVLSLTNPNVILSELGLPAPTFSDLLTNGVTGVDFPHMDSERYYTYYWKLDNVDFLPPLSPGEEFGTSMRTITIEAFDRLGSMHDLERRVRVDTNPPVLTLSMFDNDRGAVNPNGKVEFRISASDMSGLQEERIGGVDYEGVKWWVLPAGTYTGDANGILSNPETVWNLPFPNPVGGLYPNGLGQRFLLDLDQEAGSGQLGVFDSRALTNGASYQLVAAAVDKANNYVAKVMVPSFTVLQSADIPTMDFAGPSIPLRFNASGQPEYHPTEATESKKRAAIKNKETLVFEGIIRDDDRFDPAKANTYVQIRFPASTNAQGVPTWPADNVGWSNIPATIDSSGALSYRLPYSQIDAATRDGYLSTDGRKYYQIRVTDEVNADTPIPGRSKAFYGKNPRRASDATAADATAAANRIIGIQDPRIIPARTEQFPVEVARPGGQAGGTPGYYCFILDTNQPKVQFNWYDPNYNSADPDYAGYDPTRHPAGVRPVYNDVNSLLDNLTGHVIEANLNTLVIQFGSFARRTLRVDDADGSTAPRAWGVAEPLYYVLYDSDGDPVDADGTKPPRDPNNPIKVEELFVPRLFINEWNNAAQGSHSINMEALDHAGLPNFVPWMFYKDTRGPDVVPISFSRAIPHPTIPPVPATANNFLPANWPLDWPHGTKWKNLPDPSDYITNAFPTGSNNPDYIAARDVEYPKWQTLRSTYGVDNWPSSFAFYFDDPGAQPANTAAPLTRANKIRNALEAENNRALTPNVVTGDPISLKGSSNYNAPEIRGSFQDEFLAVSGTFEYRLSNNAVSAGRFNADGSVNETGWKTMDITGYGQSQMSANWTLKLDEDNLNDGLVTLDISVKDSMGNKADVFGLQFLLDRQAPYFFGELVGSNPNLATQDRPERINVNHAAPTLPTPPPFPSASWVILEDEIQRVFGSEGSTGTLADPVFQLKGYVYEHNLSKLNVLVSQDGDVYQSNISWDVDTNTFVYTTNYLPGTDDTNLVVTRIAGTNVYEWTLSILNKGVQGLRAGATTTAGADRRDGVRHFVRLQTIDKADRVNAGTMRWNFYLDTKSPTIEYTNLEADAPPSSTPSVFAPGTTGNPIALLGIASDDTGIQTVQYSIAKWNYDEAKWKWRSTNSWEDTQQSWSTVPEPNLDRARTSVNWRIDAAMLQASGIGFNPITGWEEGRYRLDLRVTDYSLGSGNPYETYDSGAAQTVNANARVFYIDERPPVITWSDTDSSQYYSNNADGQVTFNITVQDGNTIKSVTAQVMNADGSDIPDAPWLVNIDPTVSGNAWDITPRDVAVKATMTDTGTSTGTALDLILPAGSPSGTIPAPKTYVVRLFVEDGAGRLAIAETTRQFTLDNMKPDFPIGTIGPTVKPASTPDNGNWVGNEAITGSINIKGQATDNSDRFSKIAFRVRSTTDSVNFTPAPDPTRYGDESDDWHYYSGTASLKDTMGTSQTTDDRVLMEIQPGTAAWEIQIPLTRYFQYPYSADRPGYVHWGIVGNTTVIGPTTTFAQSEVSPYNGHAIPLGQQVGKLVIDILVEDLAINQTVKTITYWIYPEGDRPVVSAINNPSNLVVEAQRMLNGNIRISGIAIDNDKVKYVYFRVLNGSNVTVNGVAPGMPYVLNVPEWYWDTTQARYDWERTAGINQTALNSSVMGNALDGDTVGNGWYMANRGGDGYTTATWWAIINTASELNPTTDGGINRIIIQVRAEDTARVPGSKIDWMPVNRPGTSNALNEPGMLSTAEEVVAFVVNGVPKFDVEEVMSGPSSDSGNWRDVSNASVRRRAAYRIVVKNKTGIGSIRWTATKWDKEGLQFIRDGGSINLLDPNVEYNTTTYTNDLARLNLIPNGPNTNMFPGQAGMAAKAGPHPDYMKTGNSATTSAMTNGKTYMVWKWAESLRNANFGVLNIASDTPVVGQNGATQTDVDNHYKFTEFVYTGPNATVNLGAAQVLERHNTLDSSDPNNDYYLWVVTVDVDTRQLEALLYGGAPGWPSGSGWDEEYGFKYPDGSPKYPARALETRGSILFPIFLDASDNSGSSPLTTSRRAELPIDNNPPKGEFTLNRRPAGESPAVGGEAGDDGPVNGVERVILWFSRNGSRTSWREKDFGSTGARGFIPYTTTSGYSNWADDFIADGVFTRLSTDPATVRGMLPAIPAENTPDGNNGASAVVIDANNPMSPPTPGRYGQSLKTGFTNGGSLGKVWYFIFDSMKMDSGPVLMHYVVIDTAGNARYYEDRIVIMNNAPQISQIKLATDIRGQTLVSSTPLPNPLSSTASSPNGSTTLAILDRFREYAKGLDGGPASDDEDLDPKSGITNWIYSPALRVDQLIDFSARNNLLALRVETSQPPDGSKARRFRFEYVSGATLIEDIKDVKAGLVYIVDSETYETTAKLGGLGAEGDGPWPKGYSFLAAVNGTRNDSSGEPTISGYARLWELNTTYYSLAPATPGNPPSYIRNGVNTLPANLRLADADYPTGGSTATNAEFVYANSSFGSGSRIHDWAGLEDWPAPWSNADTPPEKHSLFILRVFDGDESDLFSDFKLIRIRVNNNDQTQPFAQLYDVNPYTEGQNRRQERQRSLAPMKMGENRTRGGLWNQNESTTTGSSSHWTITNKPGHIEPRAIPYAIPPYIRYRHSLAPEEMGGDEYTSSVGRDHTGSTVNPNGFFEVDTVSGRVILRGYVEDDQLIERVALEFTQEGASTPQSINILTQANSPPNAAEPIDFKPATTGFLRVADNTATNPTTDRVYFHDTIDVYRHRVEWAYIWDTEAIPANTIVGKVTVRAVSFNKNTNNPAAKESKIMEAGTDTEETHLASSITNPDFVAGLFKYNTINFNLRPYIIGFRRDQSKSYNNYRSLQGRVALSRGERPVIIGYNLGGGNTNGTTVSLTNATLTTDTGHDAGEYGLASEWASSSRSRRLATITRRSDAGSAAGDSTGAQTGDGKVVLNVARPAGTNYPSANTSTERPLLNASGSEKVSVGGSYWIQPWNSENFRGVTGSDLWDDYTSVHIWESEGARTGRDNGYFRSTNSAGNTDDYDNWVVMNPAMTIDTNTGELYASHNQGGPGNVGTAITSTSSGTGPTTVMSWVDPMIFSNIYRSPGGGTTGTGGATWTVTSVVGRYAATGQGWGELGGIYIDGPNGGAAPHGASYLVESAWFNASSQSPTVTEPPSTDQFLTPHIVTSYSNPGTSDAAEHIHTSYYDSKDRSIKYRHNLRSAAGTVTAGTDALRKETMLWINLDGGFDLEDADAGTAMNYNLQQANNNTAIPTSTTAVTYNLSTEATAYGYGLIPDGTPSHFHLQAQATANSFGTIPTSETAVQRTFAADATTLGHGTIPAPTYTNYHLSSEATSSQHGYGTIPTSSTADTYTLLAEARNLNHIGTTAAFPAISSTEYHLSTELTFPPHNTYGTIPTSATAVEYSLNGDATAPGGPGAIPAPTYTNYYLSSEATAPGHDYGTIPTTVAAVTYYLAAESLEQEHRTVPPTNTLMSYHLRAQAARLGHTLTVSATAANYSQNTFHTIANADYRYVRNVYVTEGQYVLEGDHIYTLGSTNTSDTSQLYEVYAPKKGTITTVRTVGWRSTTPAGDGTAYRMFTITDLPENYIHQVLATGFVTEGTNVYRIGVQNPTTNGRGRAPTYLFTAPVSGTLSNVRAAGEQVTDGAAADGAGAGTTAQRLFSITPVALNYIKAVGINPVTNTYWANGDYVAKDDVIFTFGENPNGADLLNPSPSYVFKARIEGVLSNLATYGTQITNTGATVAARLYTITPVALNYVRVVHNALNGSGQSLGRAWQDGDYVRASNPVYTIGAQNMTNAYSRASTYQFHARTSGTVWNLSSVGQAITTTGTANGAPGAAGNARMYTLYTGLNHVRKILPARDVNDQNLTRTWENGDYVRQDDPIYEIGEHPSVDPTGQNVYIFKARSSGFITNLSSVGHRFSVAAIASNQTPNTVNTTAAAADRGAAANTRLYTITPAALNFVQAVYRSDGDYVPANTRIYTIGARGSTDPRVRSYDFYTRSAGTIWNLSSVGDRLAVTGTTNGLPNAGTDAAPGNARLYTLFTGRNHVRRVHPARDANGNALNRALINGDYIKVGEPIYTIGQHPSIDPPTEPEFIFTARKEGTLGNLSNVGHRFEVTGVAAGEPNAVTTVAAGRGAATNARLYTITGTPLNYVREVLWNNGDYVRQGLPVYRIGAQSLNNERSTVYEFRAAASGTIWNLSSVGQAIVATGTTNQEPGNIYNTRMYTLYTGRNHVRIIHPARGIDNVALTRPWEDGDYVKVGEPIYTIGQHPSVDPPTEPVYVFTALTEGFITNLSSVGHRFAVSGTTANAPNAVNTTAAAADRGAATNARLYTITPVALNYIRRLHKNTYLNNDQEWKNTDYVPQGEIIYTIGAANTDNLRATSWDFPAPMSGYLSNMRAPPAQVTVGTATDGTAAPTAITTPQRLFTIEPIALNYIQTVHNAKTRTAWNTADIDVLTGSPPQARAWQDGDYVRVGDLIYTIGQQRDANGNPPANTPEVTTTYDIYAKTEGVLSNMSARNYRFAVTGTTAATPGPTVTTNARLYTITPVALNYLQYIRPGTQAGVNAVIGNDPVVYRFGAANQAAYPRSSVYEIRAPFEGALTYVFRTSAQGVGSSPFTVTNTNTGALATTVAGPAYTHIVFTITRTGGSRIVDYANRNGLPINQRLDAGFFNDIATTAEGYPVVAYHDATNNRLKLAVSRKFDPDANDWVIRDYVVSRTNYGPLTYGTGSYVTLKVNHIQGPGEFQERNRVHIAALNSSGSQLIYITGILNPTAGNGNTIQTDANENSPANNVLTGVTVQVVDSVGTVGRWSTISLDENGYPWIAYMDEANRGNMDGVKMAYYNPTKYQKEINDAYGKPLKGWETMHVPARFKVDNQYINTRENGRLGMECYPARNYPPSSPGNTRFWNGAVAYLGTGTNPDTSSTDVRTRYRIAYYVK